MPFKDSACSPAAAAVDNSSDSDYIPSVPVLDCRIEHRPHLCPQHVHAACVARPVTRKEARENAKALAAMDKEWNKLRNIGCWDESRVQEWKHVASNARRDGTKVHIGRIFDIFVEKNSELEENNPNRVQGTCRI